MFQEVYVIFKDDAVWVNLHLCNETRLYTKLNGYI